MTPTSTLIDAAERERLRVDFEQTFFVEAGAGTGKTTVLVARVVALIAAGLLRTAGLVAITFTEAAAAELRGRIRAELEAVAAEAGRDDEERRRCAEAAGSIDLAAIQTIHAFAAALLRTYPIEARLPPGFEVWDDVQFTLAFEERFQTWLTEEVIAEDKAGRERRGVVQRALLLGLKFDQLRSLARAFQEHTDILPSLDWPSDPPSNTVGCAREMGKSILGLGGMIRFAKNGDADPLVQEIRRLQSGALRLRDAGDDLEALLALQALPEPKAQKGKKGDWRTDESGVNAADTIKGTLKEMKSTREMLLTEHRAAALGAVLGQVRAFTLDFARERRRQGAAAFHDLLVWTRDLLRDNSAVRERARARFERIFVDEFQDTDPLQAEIIWYLTADHASSAEDWVRAPLQPGKLFLVGDPKQSIYRFRGADIRLVGEIFERGGPRAVLQVRQNFRSARVVLAWVNHHFARDLQDEPGIQAPHVNLEVSHEGPDGAKVLAIGEAMVGKSAELRAAEAHEVAALIRTAVDEGWQVRDGTETRPARYDDVCLLMPGRAGLRVLEDALEAARIPYRVEAGTLVLDTQEVRDVLAALRAIDDPSDQVALVAALRSPAYACSDADLLRWVEAGGTFDYQRETELAGPVADAFRSLRRFHGLRQERSAAWLIETFIRERMLAVQTFGYSHPREAWRRLRYLVAQARALAGAGRPGLRSLVNWLEDRQREGVRDQESPRPDSDEEAVRLMTIHGAKGLEFPIVILSDLGRQPRSRLGNVIRNRIAGTLEVKIGELATRGYAETADLEKAYDRAENVRLLYVAATRARDYLVLSLMRKISKVDASDAGRIDRYLAEAPELATRFVAPDVSPLVESGSSTSDTSVEDDTSASYTMEEDCWFAERESRVAAASALSRLAVAELAQRGGVSLAESVFQEAIVGAPDDEVSPSVDEESVDPLEARRVGRAVHAVLESSSWGTRSEITTLASALAERFGVEAGRVERLVRGILASPLIAEARRARQRWHEVPVGVGVGGTFLEGRVDLIFTREDGTVGILDFKTGAADPEIVAANSRADRLQGGAYALAVEQVSGQTVGVVGIVYAARDGYTVVFPDVAALIAEVRASLAGANDNLAL